jgi:outer membrane autotransporter protein
MMSDTPDQVTGPDPLLHRWGTFITGNAILASQGATSSQASVNSTTVDFNLGTDYKLNKEWTVGFLAGYGKTTADLDSYGSRLTATDYRVGPYGSYTHGNWYVNGHTYYGINIADSTRAIPDTQVAASGKPDGDQYGTDFDTGYKFHSGNLTYGPTAGIQYTHIDINSYQENGATIFDLAVGKQQVDSVIASLGGEVSYDFHSAWNRLTFRPEFDASWQHECLNTSQTIGEAFVTPGTGVYQVTADGLPRDSAVIGAGISAILNNGSLLFLRYDAQIGQQNYSAQSITGGLRVVF